MPRSQFFETVTVALGPGGSLIPVPGIGATPILIDPSTYEELKQVPAYANRTGSAVVTSVVTDANGNVAYWLDDGEYNIHFSDSQSPARIPPYIRGFTSPDVTGFPVNGGGGTGGVGRIIPGTGIGVSPSSGQGNVTVINTAPYTGGGGNGGGTALDIYMTGDMKWSLQPSDHGLQPNGSYSWVLMIPAGTGAGRALSSTLYSALWNLLGRPTVTAGMFNLPNYAGRVFVPTGQGAGLSRTWSSGTQFGEETHTMTVTELVQHNHGGVTGTGSTGTGSTGTGSTAAGTSGGWSGSTGGGTSGTDSPDHAHEVPTRSVAEGAQTGRLQYTATGGLPINQGPSYGANARHAHSIPALSIPNHTHSVPAMSIPALSVPALSVPALAINNQGTGTPFNVYQPTVGMNLFVKS